MLSLKNNVESTQQRGIVAKCSCLHLVLNRCIEEVHGLGLLVVKMQRLLIFQ